MINYIINMILCSGGLLLGYFLLLQQEKMYRFSRFYLLFSLLAALAIPLITINWHPEAMPLSMPLYIMEEAPFHADTVLPAIESVRDKTLALHPVFIAYGSITLLLLFRFLRNLIQLQREMQAGPSILYHNVKFLLLSSPTAPHSFFNRVFVNRHEFETGQLKKEILHHEMAHVRQRHSADILLVELLLVFCWFNPFLYGFKKAIRLNHELLADDAVVKTFPDIPAYQQLMLAQISSQWHSSLTSSFNYLITKKRFTMMSKTFSPARAVLKGLALIPLLAAAVIVFSTKAIAQDTIIALVDTGGQKPALKQPPAGNKKDTPAVRDFWVGMSIGYTKEGASEALLKEYAAILSKYKKGEELVWHDGLQNMPAEEKSRLETIFRQMSLEQQKKQAVIFTKPPKPFARLVPSEQQLSAFKNAEVYGVWIDGKKVTNEKLGQYKRTDFAHYFISRLYGAAKKGRTYTHQLDLMTNAYYKDYYDQAMKNQKASMVLVRHQQKTTQE